MDELLDREGLSWNEYYRRHGYIGDFKESSEAKFWAAYWRAPEAFKKKSAAATPELPPQNLFQKAFSAIKSAVRWLRKRD